jgi:hypothetical protein
MIHAMIFFFFLFTRPSSILSITGRDQTGYTVHAGFCIFILFAPKFNWTIDGRRRRERAAVCLSRSMQNNGSTPDRPIDFNNTTHKVVGGFYWLHNLMPGILWMCCPRAKPKQTASGGKKEDAPDVAVT